MKKKCERERERERERNNILCMGKLCIEWKKEICKFIVGGGE